jgi:UDP-N-acetylmuramoylalanine--D-glutamate ligase
MKIAILGFDIEGRASYDYFVSQGGHEITVCDQKTDVEVPNGVESVLGEAYLDNLGRFDLLVRTAGLPPSKIFDKNPGVESKITTHVNEFMGACPTRNIIGVTGTKGKGTTSTMITRMLEADGRNVRLGGNIGVPPLTFLDELDENSWVVLELSSFQLVDMKVSPHIGVCLMVVAEHLNWHPDMANYTAAKTQLFAHQSAEDKAIYYAGNPYSTEIASVSRGVRIPYSQPPGAYVEDGDIVIDGQVVCSTEELKLLGKHNWQNACAAVTALWQVTQNIDAMRAVLTSFAGLEHRLEQVRELDGVTYYNDSFAATPDAAIAAMEAIEGPKVLIAGGFDRGLPIDHLAKAIAAHASDLRKLVIIGASSRRLAEELQKTGFDNFIVDDSKDMAAVVSDARTAAQAGDSVVLSPGFASFDMFKNFADRGEQFKQAVNEL